MGYVPFPRADNLVFDDPAYRDWRIPGESYAILKGTDPEKIPLAIQAAYMYLNGETGEPEVAEEEDQEVFIGLDMFHPEIGQDMVGIYHKRKGETVVNELADVFKVSGKFIILVGNSIYGHENTPRYPVAIQQQIGIFQDVMDTMDYSYPVGTDLNQIDFIKDFTAKDNVDGDLDMANASFEIVEVDSTVPGTYEAGLHIKIKDSVGNEAISKFNVVIFDEKNTIPPTLVAKEEYRDIKLEEDTSKINWANDFMESVADKDGISLNKRLQADLSELDTSAVGKYNVILTATDFANNETTIKIEVAVVKPDTNV